MITNCLVCNTKMNNINSGTYGPYKKIENYSCKSCDFYIRYFDSINEFDISIKTNNNLYAIYIDTNTKDYSIEIISYDYKSGFPTEMKEYSLNNIELDKNNIEKSCFNILLKFINNLEFV